MNPQQGSGHLEISDLPRGEVLAALYNATVPSGAAVLHYRYGFLDAQQAQAILENPNAASQLSIDFWRGRTLKLDFSGSSWNPQAYEQVAGLGMAKEVLAILRQTHQPDHPEIRRLHYKGLLERSQQENWTQKLLEELKLPELAKGLKEAMG